MHFAGQIDGHARVYKAFNPAVNTHMNVRNATHPSFILHTLTSQCINTYIKTLQETPQNVLHNTEGSLYHLVNRFTAQLITANHRSS